MITPHDVTVKIVEAYDAYAKGIDGGGDFNRFRNICLIGVAIAKKLLNEETNDERN